MPMIDEVRDPASLAPGRVDRWRRLRTRASRYLRRRAADLFGDPGPFRAVRDGIARTSAALDFVFDRPPRGRAEEGRRAQESGRARPAEPVLRHRYRTEATVTQAFFSAAVVSVLVCGHRLWLVDTVGAGASLGMAFTLAAFALKPAYRCWLIRTRAPADPRAFLRQPSAWWPYPLPPDDPA